MTRRLLLLALGVLLGVIAGAVAAPSRAGACADGRTAPWCTTTSSAPRSTTTAPAPTTTRYGYDLVIPDPPTTTVQVIDLPPVVVDSAGARAPEPAQPIYASPRFAG